MTIKQKVDGKIFSYNNDQFPEDNFKSFESFRVCETAKQGAFSLQVKENMDRSRFEALSCVVLPSIGSNNGVDLYLDMDIEVICTEIDCNAAAGKSFILSAGLTLGSDVTHKENQIKDHFQGRTYLELYRQVFESVNFHNDLSGRSKKIKLQKIVNLPNDFTNQENFPIDLEYFKQDFEFLKRFELHLFENSPDQILDPLTNLPDASSCVKNVNCNKDSYFREIPINSNIIYSENNEASCTQHPKDILKINDFFINSYSNTDVGYNLDQTKIIEIPDSSTTRIPWQVDFEIMLSNIFDYEKFDFEYSFELHGKFRGYDQVLSLTEPSQSSEVKKDLLISMFSSETNSYKITSVDKDGLPLKLSDLILNDPNVPISASSVENYYWTDLTKLCIKIMVVVPNEVISESIDYNNFKCVPVTLKYPSDSISAYADSTELVEAEEKGSHSLRLNNLSLKNEGNHNIDLTNHWVGSVFITVSRQLNKNCTKMQNLGWADINLYNRKKWYPGENIFFEYLEIPLLEDIWELDLSALKDEDIRISVNRDENLDLGLKVSAEAYCGPEKEEETLVLTAQKNNIFVPEGLKESLQCFKNYDDIAEENIIVSDVNSGSPFLTLNFMNITGYDDGIFIENIWVRKSGDPEIRQHSTFSINLASKITLQNKNNFCYKPSKPTIEVFETQINLPKKYFTSFFDKTPLIESWPTFFTPRQQEDFKLQLINKYNEINFLPRFCGHFDLVLDLGCRQIVKNVDYLCELDEFTMDNLHFEFSEPNLSDQIDHDVVLDVNFEISCVSKSGICDKSSAKYLVVEGSEDRERKTKINLLEVVETNEVDTSEADEGQNDDIEPSIDIEADSTTTNQNSIKIDLVDKKFDPPTGFGSRIKVHAQRYLNFKKIKNFNCENFNYIHFTLYTDYNQDIAKENNFYTFPITFHCENGQDIIDLTANFEIGDVIDDSRLKIKPSFAGSVFRKSRDVEMIGTIDEDSNSGHGDQLKVNYVLFLSDTSNSTKLSDYPNQQIKIISEYLVTLEKCEENLFCLKNPIEIEFSCQDILPFYSTITNHMIGIWIDAPGYLFKSTPLEKLSFYKFPKGRYDEVSEQNNIVFKTFPPNLKCDCSRSSNSQNQNSQQSIDKNLADFQMQMSPDYSQILVEYSIASKNLITVSTDNISNKTQLLEAYKPIISPIIIEFQSMSKNTDLVLTDRLPDITLSENNVYPISVSQSNDLHKFQYSLKFTENTIPSFVDVKHKMLGNYQKPMANLVRVKFQDGASCQLDYGPKDFSVPPQILERVIHIDYTRPDLVSEKKVGVNKNSTDSTDKGDFTFITSYGSRALLANEINLLSGMIRSNEQANIQKTGNYAFRLGLSADDSTCKEANDQNFLTNGENLYAQKFYKYDWASIVPKLSNHKIDSDSDSNDFGSSNKDIFWEFSHEMYIPKLYKCALLIPHDLSDPKSNLPIFFKPVRTISTSFDLKLIREHLKITLPIVLDENKKTNFELPVSYKVIGCPDEDSERLLDIDFKIYLIDEDAVFTKLMKAGNYLTALVSDDNGQTKDSCYQQSVSYIPKELVEFEVPSMPTKFCGPVGFRVEVQGKLRNPDQEEEFLQNNFVEIKEIMMKCAGDVFVVTDAKIEETEKNDNNNLDVVNLNPNKYVVYFNLHNLYNHPVAEENTMIKIKCSACSESECNELPNDIQPYWYPEWMKPIVVNDLYNPYAFKRIGFAIDLDEEKCEEIFGDHHQFLQCQVNDMKVPEDIISNNVVRIPFPCRKDLFEQDDDQDLPELTTSGYKTSEPSNSTATASIQQPLGSYFKDHDYDQKLSKGFSTLYFYAFSLFFNL